MKKETWKSRKHAEGWLKHFLDTYLERVDNPQLVVDQRQKVRGEIPENGAYKLYQPDGNYSKCPESVKTQMRNLASEMSM